MRPALRRQEIWINTSSLSTSCHLVLKFKEPGSNHYVNPAFDHYDPALLQRLPLHLAVDNRPQCHGGRVWRSTAVQLTACLVDDGSIRCKGTDQGGIRVCRDLRLLPCR